MMLYIGTYNEDSNGGIYFASFNARTGDLGATQAVAATSNPSFLAASPDGCFLYAVNEWGQVASGNAGGLSAFQVEQISGQLTPLNAVSMGGILCHLTVDTTGNWLLAAAYEVGTVSIWPLQVNGRIGPRAGLIQHTGKGPNQDRQSAPHAHQVVLSPDGRQVFVVDLGTDKVMISDFDSRTGQLTPAETPSIALASGEGPRHLAFSKNGDFLYVVSELDNTITIFKDAIGVPQQIQVVSTLPADYASESHTAEIDIHPGGHFLYASNRGHDSLAGYSIEADGRLKAIGFTPTGRTPRHFSFDPSGKWLLTANQDDRSISVFSVDTQTGALTLKHEKAGLPDKPTCLLFLEG